MPLVLFSKIKDYLFINVLSKYLCWYSYEIYLKLLAGVAANPLPAGASLAGLYSFPNTNEAHSGTAGNGSTAVPQAVTMTTPSTNGAATLNFQPNSDLSSLGLTALPSESNFICTNNVIFCPRLNLFHLLIISTFQRKSTVLPMFNFLFVGTWIQIPQGTFIFKI